MKPVALQKELESIAREDPGTPCFTYSQRDRELLGALLHHLHQNGWESEVELFCAVSSFGGTWPTRVGALH